MRKVLPVFLVLLVLLSPIHSQVEETDTVAVVNGIPILVSEMLAEISQLPKRQQAQMGDQARKQILGRVVNRKLLLQQAKQAKLDTLPTIKAKIERAKEQVLVNSLLNAVVSSNRPQKITDRQLRKYYQENDSLFRQPKRLELSQIVVKTKKTAEKVKKKLQGGEDFAKLARKHSISQDASRGGDAGYFTRSQLHPNIAKEVFSLNKGEVSDIISFNDNYSIVKVTDIAPASKISFTDNKDKIKQQIYRQLAQNSRKQYKNKLRKNAELSTNNKVLYNFKIPMQEQLRRQQQQQRQQPQGRSQQPRRRQPQGSQSPQQR